MDTHLDPSGSRGKVLNLFYFIGPAWSQTYSHFTLLFIMEGGFQLTLLILSYKCFQASRDLIFADEVSIVHDTDNSTNKVGFCETYPVAFLGTGEAPVRFSGNRFCLGTSG